MENIDYLIKYLLNDNPQVVVKKEAEDINEKIGLYRSLCNIREARSISDEYIKKEHEFLEALLKNSKVTHVNTIESISKTGLDNNLSNPDKIALWKGDITKLEIGAIVNAANSRGLGCFIPGHICIDNQIHTFAGIPLRLECSKIMKTMNNNLPTGESFITKAYSLPSDYVIHTVGPIINNSVEEYQKEQLANCYTSSLKLAIKNNIRTVAFPCISTGVFKFPKQLAAKIAVNTVDKFISENPDSFDLIVFDLYDDTDVIIYENSI